jgi:hypothetical protein
MSRRTQRQWHAAGDCFEPGQLRFKGDNPTCKRTLSPPRRNREEPRLEAEQVRQKVVVLLQPGLERRLRQGPIADSFEERMPGRRRPLLEVC